MPRLAQIRTTLNSLKNDSESLPWYAKLVFPAQLKTALTAYQTPGGDEIGQILTICNTFLNHTWFFQRWFLSCLQAFSKSDLIKTYKNSGGADSIKSAIEEEAKQSAIGEEAEQRKLNEKIKEQANRSDTRMALLQRYCDQVKNHPNRNVIGLSIVELGPDLLVGEAGKANFETILVQEGHAPHIATCLVKLNKAGLISGDKAQANRAALKNCASLGDKNLEEVVSALRILEGEGLLSKEMAQANFDAVITHQAPCAVAHALSSLNKAGLLSGDKAQANRAAFKKCASLPGSLEGVACTIRNLVSTGLLSKDFPEITQANFDAVIRHEAPEAVADAVIKLNRAGLLSGDKAQANFEAIVTHKDPRVAYDLVSAWDLPSKERLEAKYPTKGEQIFNMLEREGLLDEANFEALLGEKDSQVVFSLIKCLSVLKHAEILTPSNRAVVKACAFLGGSYLEDLRGAFLKLKIAGLFSIASPRVAQANFNTVINSTNPEAEADTLIQLNDAKLLAEDEKQTGNGNGNSPYSFFPFEKRGEPAQASRNLIM
jgi:hypothetical protein